MPHLRTGIRTQGGRRAQRIVQAVHTREEIVKRIKFKMYLRMVWQDWQCKIHGHLWEAHHAYTGPGDPLPPWAYCTRCGETVEK